MCLPSVKDKLSNEQFAPAIDTYTIQLQLKKPKPSNDSVFFRYAVVNSKNEEKAIFWFEESNNGNIYTVYARFTDERYSWIQLFVEVDDAEGTDRYYPTEVYMDTYSMKMNADQCRDIIRYFTEAAAVCDTINEFFKDRKVIE